MLSFIRLASVLPPPIFSVGGRCREKSSDLFGGKVRTDEIETASGTPLSVWCLGRLSPLVKCAVEEEKHNEIIGLEKSTGLQRPHVSLWGMGKKITFFLPSQHTSLLSFSIKARLNKVEENFFLFLFFC